MLKAGAIALAIVAIATPALAQAPRPVISYHAPRAADGHPDLQGTWTNASITRLERNARLSPNLVMTEAEAAAAEGQTKAITDLSNAPTRPDATVKDLPADCSGGRVNNCNYNAAWTDPGSSIMRVAGKPRSGFITTTPDGRVPPLTAEAQRRLRETGARRARVSDNPETRALGERCLLSFGASSGPVMTPVLYNNTYQIVQTRDQVAIEVEMVHDLRVVRLGAKHLPAPLRPWMGDSVGWWEGETLVVETTNYHPQQSLRGASEHLKVTERFTRVAPDRLHYAFWVEDPTTFTKPWGGEYEFTRSPGALYEYACHEGNYGLVGILEGARAEDRTGVRTAPTNPGEGEEGGP